MGQPFTRGFFLLGKYDLSFLPKSLIFFFACSLWRSVAFLDMCQLTAQFSFGVPIVKFLNWTIPSLLSSISLRAAATSFFVTGSHNSFRSRSPSSDASIVPLSSSSYAWKASSKNSLVSSKTLLNRAFSSATLFLLLLLPIRRRPLFNFHNDVQSFCFDIYVVFRRNWDVLKL